MQPAYIALQFAPDTAVVHETRRFTESFFGKIVGSSGSRIALAAHELLENAVSYCAEGTVTIRIALLPVGDDQMVTITTRNRAKEEHVHRLMMLIQRLHDDGAEFGYAKALERAASAHLGLVRVCAEATMTIACDVHDQEVEVRATGLLNS